MLNTDFVAWLYGYVALVSARDGPLIETDIWGPLQRAVVKAHAQLTEQSSVGVVTITISWILHDIDNISWDQIRTTIARDFRLKPILSGNEAAYFLQGYFEVAGPQAPATLTRLQARVIAHEMERNVDGFAPMLLDFYWELRTFLAATEPVVFDTIAMQQRLNELFLHVIDNSYGFDEATQARLQEVHDSYKAIPAPQSE